MSHDAVLNLECKCQYCEDQRFQETLKKVGQFVGGFIVTTLLCEVAILAAPVALGAVGFGAGGVRAASWAARIQSWIGNVRKGSAFARMTSMAMKGALSPGAAQGIRAVFQTLYVGGAAAEALLKKDMNGEFIVPRTPEELDDLVNEGILRGLICGRCKKRIDNKLRNRCTSVCWCRGVRQFTSNNYM